MWKADIEFAFLWSFLSTIRYPDQKTMKQTSKKHQKRLIYSVTVILRTLAWLMKELINLYGVRKTKNHWYRSTGRSGLTGSTGTGTGKEKALPVPSVGEQASQSSYNSYISKKKSKFFKIRCISFKKAHLLLCKCCDYFLSVYFDIWLLS
jgi:hypothetical protein